MVSLIPRSSSTAFPIIKEILSLGWVEIPEQFQGTGAPGNTLEYLVEVNENNMDSPDLQDWELKFHGGSSSLLTLFHKDPEPRGIIKEVVDKFGWANDKGKISFRHTIKGETARGFKVVNENNRISIVNKYNKDIVPYWDHNTLLGQLGGKLRRLIIVHGEVKRENRKIRKVKYNSATAFWDIDLVGFSETVEKGIVYVDFDARTKAGRGSGLRNHGTKFRIKIENIGHLYKNSQLITAD